MSRMRSWIATEELEMPEVVAPEVAEVPSETVEAQLVEVDGLDRQIETLIDDGQTLAEDTDNVEQLEETVESTEEEGGMDETAAEVVEIATEAFCAKWGIRRTKIAKENFGDSSTRRQATRVALEDLSSAISGMWDTFIKFIQTIIDKAKDMFISFTNAGSRMQKRANKMKEAAKKKFKEKQKVSSETLEGGWTKFCVFDDNVDVAALLAFAKTPANVQVSQANARALVVCSEAAVAAAEEKADEGMFSKMGDSISNAYKSILNMFKSVKPYNIPDSAMNISAQALSGNVILSNYTIDGVSTFALGTKPLPKEIKVPTLKEGDINTAIDVLLGLGKMMEQAIKDFRTSDKELAALKSDISKAKGKVTEAKKGSDGSKEFANKALKRARVAVMNCVITRRAMNIGQTNAGQGLIGLIEGSMKAHEAA